MQNTYLFYALLTVSILHTRPTTRKSSRNYDRRILRNMQNVARHYNRFRRYIRHRNNRILLYLDFCVFHFQNCQLTDNAIE
jgi:hypothetical protein